MYSECIPSVFHMYFTCISDCIPSEFVTYLSCISAVFCTVFYCILNPCIPRCILGHFRCILLRILMYSDPAVFRVYFCVYFDVPECILLYSRERHFLVPATHPPTRFSREYVFRSRILMYSQSLLRIRILRVFRVYSGVFSRYSRIRTEYRRAYLPKFYTFEIRQNTAYFRNFSEYSRIQNKIQQNTVDRKLLRIG